MEFDPKKDCKDILSFYKNKDNKNLKFDYYKNKKEKQEIEFDLLDCTFISKKEYEYIKKAFKEFNGIKFGYKLNSKNEEIYFVKDSFKVCYEKPSIYKISYNWQDKYDNY